MRWSYIVPVAVFVVIAIALGVGLTLNPRDIPSALIGKPVPAFELEPVPPRDLGLASGDLKQGEVVLINVFASWCGACREQAFHDREACAIAGGAALTVVDATPQLPFDLRCGWPVAEHNRACEIAAWMASARTHPDLKWVAIDDLDVTNSPHASFFHGHFVHTTRQKGLTQDCADAIMRILGPRSAKD